MHEAYIWSNEFFTKTIILFSGHDTSTDSNKDTPKQDISNHTLLIIIFSVVGVILVFAIIGCFVLKYRVARKINEITAIPEKTNGMNDPSAPMMAPEHAINHAYSQSASYCKLNTYILLKI